MNANPKPATPPSATPSSSESASDTDTEGSEFDDGVCDKCAVCYQDDEDSRQSWMGCDTCDR